MTWNPNYQPYRLWIEQIAKEAESKSKIKRKNCDKFQTRQNNTDNTIKYGDDKKSEKSDRTDNSSLKNPRKLYDCKKKKNQRIQRLAIQALRKASLGDILLKRIQPSLSKREWIINQRQISREKPKIYTTKDVSKSESKSFEFEKTKVYHNKKKWRNKKRDNSENRIKRLTKVKDFDKNIKDKQKMRRKREDISENERKLIQKNKHWQTYEEDNDGSIRSFDSEIYLTDVLSESKSFEFEKTEVYHDNKKWRNKKRDNSENRIKRLTKVKDFDKNIKDKQKMRRKREDISENERKLIQKNKHWQTYEEDNDGSIRSFDSEIYLTDVLSESKSFEFEKTEVYHDKKKWRNKKRDNSENRIKRLTKVKDFDKNIKDKQKMRRKREDISENERKLIQKNKHWQTYEEDNDGSIRSFDSEIYLTDVSLESKSFEFENTEVYHDKKKRRNKKKR